MPTINRKPIKMRRPPQVMHNNDPTKFYNSKSWKMLRHYYISTHPLCEVCLQKNIVTAAEHVHHISPFMWETEEERKWELLLNENNLQSVCTKCHNKIHKKLNDKKTKNAN